MENRTWSAVLKHSKSCVILLAALLAAIGLARAADFKGATEVLRQASQTSAKPKEKPKDPYEPFREKLKSFQAQSTNLPPADAARQWLALVEEFEKESKTAASTRQRPGMVRPVQFDEVMNTLPPPSAWGELAKAIEARPAAPAKGEEKRELGLRLIAHTLTGNTVKRAEDLKALSALAKSGSRPEARYEFASVFSTLNDAILATMDDPEAILRMLESQINSAGDSPMPLRVPNLVVLVGPAKAEEFFRKAFTTKCALQLEPGTPTHKLATRLALEMVNEMPNPQWGMVNSLESVDLYEALDKKFNAKKSETQQAPPDTGFFGVRENRVSREDNEARLYYFLGLIARDRIGDAIKVAREFDRDNSVYFPPEVIKQMERAGLTQQLNNFFASLLKENPESPFWGEYVRVAAHAGHADEALNLVRTTAERKDLSRERRSELKGLLPTALLANDDVEAGIAELRRSSTNEEPASTSRRYDYSSIARVGQSELLIARIGQLLDRKDWVEEGIAAARKKLKENSETPEGYWDNPELELATLLSDLGRGPEAEDVLLTALTKAVQSSQSRQEEFNRYGRGQSQAPAVLGGLLKVYHVASRFEDVVRLLDEAEYWGVKDLMDLRATSPDVFAMSYAGGHHFGCNSAGLLCRVSLGKDQPEKGSDHDPEFSAEPNAGIGPVI